MVVCIDLYMGILHLLNYLYITSKWLMGNYIKVTRECNLSFIKIFHIDTHNMTWLNIHCISRTKKTIVEYAYSWEPTFKKDKYIEKCIFVINKGGTHVQEHIEISKKFHASLLRCLSIPENSSIQYNLFVEVLLSFLLWLLHFPLSYTIQVHLFDRVSPNFT